MPRMRSALALCSGLFLAIAVPTIRAVGAAGGERRPWTVEDSIGVSSFVDNSVSGEVVTRPAPLFSPDGRSFLLVTERGRMAGNLLESTIWTWPRAAVAAYLDGRAASSSSPPPPPPRAVATLAATSNSPVVTGVRWLDDSAHVAFLGKDGSPNQKLFVVDVRTGERTTIGSGDDYVVGYEFQGATIAYTTHVEMPPPPPAPEPDLVAVGRQGLTDLLYPGPLPLASRAADAIAAAPVTLHVRRDGAELPLAFTLRGRPLRLFASEWATSPPLAISPDGGSLITLAPVAPVPASWADYRPGPDAVAQGIDPADPHATADDNPFKPLQFVRVDLRTGEAAPLVAAPAGPNLGWIAPTKVFWLPGGRQAILCNTFLPPPANAEAPFVAAVDVVTGSVQPITQLRLPAYSAPRFYRLGDISWDAAAGELTIHYSSTNEAGAPPDEVFALRAGSWTRLPQGGARPPRGQAAGAPRGAADLGLAIEESFDRPPVLVGRRRGAGGAPAPAVLFDPNPQLAQLALAGVTLYHWKDAGGHPWAGLLVLPPGYDRTRRYPLVIQTHGYDMHRFFTDGVFSTGMPGRALAARGIVVLQMESPVTHYGKPADAPFQLAGYEGAVAQLAAEGRIDPHRVGIIGFSFTCYHTLYALTRHPDLFAAAAITDGVQMSYSQYLLDDADGFYQRFSETVNGGLPWGKGLAAWAAAAPDFNLDRIETPLLVNALERGELLAEWEPFDGLRRLGKPVAMLWLRSGEAPHVLVQPLHRKLSQQSAVDWFDFWLDGREDPDPAKVAQYAGWRPLRALRRPAAAGAPP